MPIKFLLLGAWGFSVFLERGGRSANFIFMGVGIFRFWDFMGSAVRENPW